MELFNELPDRREQAVEDFLTFIPIYESRMRHRSLKALLNKHQSLIHGKTCLEAGAGRGLFTAHMAALGAKKVIAVERSPVLFELLSKGLQLPNVSVVNRDILQFNPKEKIDLLFHEFYGPLVLDEALPALQKLKFKPGTLLPDGGRLWAMPLTDAQISKADEVYEKSWKQALGGAMISDLFTGIAFKPQWKVFDWDVKTGKMDFTFRLPAKCDWLALCGEITHEGNSVLKMWRTGNWPVIFTPVGGKEMKLKFRYRDGYTKVFLDWNK